MDLQTLRHSLEACMVERGFYGLSFWGENGLSFEAICRAAGLRNLRVGRAR